MSSNSVGFYNVSVVPFIKTLGRIEAFMQIAAGWADSKKVETSVLLQLRLAPDMLPLSRQIQIVCDTTKFAAGYLTGTTAPKFEDNEVTWNEFVERIAKTKAYLMTLKPEQFNGAAERKIELPRKPGQFLTGEEYLTQHALPNSYFHSSVIYALLRSNGVDIGKKDFLGDMPYKTL